MTTQTRVQAVLLVCLVTAASAFAEGPAPLKESGAYVGVGIGALYSLGAPAAPQTSVWGQGITLEARWAPITRLGISLLLFASIFDAPTTYAGTQEGGVNRGDYLSLTPAASARLNAFGFDDRWGVRRVWIYLKAGGGYSMYWPKALITQGSPFFFGGLGLEYRTHLRHLSIGLEGLASYQTAFASFTIAITPHLQFAF